MHHLTTLNLPTPSARRQDRTEIAAATAAYLAEGGHIIALQSVDRAPYRSISWNTTTSRKPNIRRLAADRLAALSAAIVELAVVQTEFGPMTRSAPEIRRALRGRGITAGLQAIEQLAARNGIILREVGKQ